MSSLQPESPTPLLTVQSPALILAPMQGVTDAPIRAFFGARGGLTYCVTEFFRISESLPSIRVFKSHVPELHNKSVTTHHLPVQVQLLGGNAELLAQAAVRAIQAGAIGIDLNFGCPAPTVNRHDGGARIGRIKGILSLDSVPRRGPSWRVLAMRISETATV